MEVTIRGWQRSNLHQKVFSRDVEGIEQREDTIVVPSGVTKVTEDGISVSFLGKANCSAQSNYMFSLRFSNADILEMVRRNWGVHPGVSNASLEQAIVGLPDDED